MKRLLILLFVFGPLSSFACSCATSPLTADGLRNQAYVALVRIKEQLPFNEANYRSGDPNFPIQYEVLVDEIVLLKGTSLQKITVSGAPPKSTTVHTSCDIDVSAGQEWLIIANAGSEGTVGIGMCGYSMLYRNKDGFRNLQYASATKRLIWVNENLGNAPLAQVLDTEKPVIYYANGQIERTVSYKNNKKHGISMYYYPDGTIYGRIEYKKDSLNGKSIWYDKKGQIQTKANYRMGVPVDSMISYMYPNAPMFVSIRSKKGIMQKFQEYQSNIASRTFSYLYSESVYKKGERISSTYFHDNGKVKFSVNYHDRGTTDLQYNESGTLIRKREFDKEGKLY
ncbi:MAG: hypothetical protein Q8S11_11770 [Daejeonella sp.]|uniref:toxin-antitoxin system YwqK family antitoxin n=1 Tax=Daejeonella sp. TaxID=2805397 RepID=UPI002734B7AB|nr:hypothetical protein [Daejeonella sp.]MDP3469006.1 hypothetical protein [Daejeonella sp.]